jgi:hypothetical protein
MTATLTTKDIEAGYEDERWLGWGYLGERDRTDGPTDRADAIVLRFAAERGWDAEDLFHWANSKDGRWFGDWAFGSFDMSDQPAWLPTLFPVRPAR